VDGGFVSLLLPLKITPSEPRLAGEYNGYAFWTPCSSAKTIQDPNKLIPQTAVDINTTYGNTKVCTEISLKDHFFMGCFNSSGCGDEWQSYVNGGAKADTVLGTVLNLGIRAVDFELFLNEERDLVVAVGIPDENNKYHLKGSYNHIPFSEILETLKSFAAPPDVSNNPTVFRNHPLLVNLRIRSNDINIYKKLGDAFSAGGLDEAVPDKKYSLKNFGSSGYKNIIDDPIHENNGKIIFMLNDNPLNPIGEYLITDTSELLRYICITDSQHENMANAVVMDSNSIINTHNTEQTLEDFKSYLGIALPDWSTIIKNPDFRKHMKMGCQISLMKFSFNDVNLREYFKYWKGKETTLHVKDKDGDIYGNLEGFKNIEGMTIVNEKKFKPMTTKQETNVNPDSQMDEAKSRKNSGAAFAEAARQFSEGK